MCIITAIDRVSYLCVEHISKKFDKGETVLKNAGFEVKKGEIAALLGESGSGKTTLLRIIAGFESHDSGTIKLDGKVLSSESAFVSPEKRQIGMIFQDYTLFPHMTVKENIAFGMDDKRNADERIQRWLKIVDLEGYENRLPFELSGGQQQRVAIARSLIVEPAILLMDEPFSNLDEGNKNKVRKELKKIIKKSNTTVLFVTHDMKDALAIADRLVILKDGEVIQSDSPDTIFRKPGCVNVAEIFGKVNMLNDATLQSMRSSFSNNGSIAIIRPFDVELSREKGAIDVTIKSCTFMGDHYDIDITTPFQEFHVHSQKPFEEGEQVKMEIPTDKIIMTKSL